MTASSSSMLSIELLHRVAKRAGQSFSGVGFIVYRDLSQLPHLSLHIPADVVPTLPMAGLDAIGEFLIQASRLSSPLHDGFHLIELSSCAITHVCQFIAPSIPAALPNLPSVSGARHVSALLASRTPGIHAAALLGRDWAGVVFESGVTIFKKTF
jgi:hypothetical protein